MFTIIDLIWYNSINELKRREHMNTAVQVASIISSIAAVVALIITVSIYFHGLKRECRLETIKAFSEIRTKYFNSESLNDHEKLQYLNELEYFATGINIGLFDIEVVKRMSKKRMLNQYNTWIKEYISERRARNGGSSSAYQEVEKMFDALGNN